VSRVMHSCPSCGSMLTKARSPSDHRRLFALINKAFLHWPHNHEFKPDSADHLRAYLQCRAGHCTSTPVFVDDVDTSAFTKEQMDVAFRLVAVAVASTVKAALEEGDYAFPRIRGLTAVVYRPRSIAWASLDQKAFGPIREAIETEIEIALGVKADELLKAEAA
jgi:hypothetical protein